MNIIVKYRVLISCPGDVADNFMQIITNSVENFNSRLGSLSPFIERRCGYIPCIEIIYWVENAVPVVDYGKSTQDVIDEQLVDTVDGTIAFFYTRLGKETDDYSSGTVEEIEKTNERNRPVSIVCITTDTFPKDLLGDGTQYKKLQEYKSSFQFEKKGYVATVPPERIEKTIDGILTKVLVQCDEKIGKSVSAFLKELEKNF